MNMDDNNMNNNIDNNIETSNNIINNENVQNNSNNIEEKKDSNILNKIKDLFKNKSKLDKKSLSMLLVIFGVIFLINFLFAIINSIDYFSKVHSSEGVVISVTENNDTTYGNYNYEVEFYDNYNEFTSSSLNSNKVYDVDDYIKVYYKESNEIFLERKNPVFFIVISIISFVIVLGLLFVLKHKPRPVLDNNAKRIKKLIKANNYITARIDNVVRNDNDQNKYYNIICKWNDSKEDRDYTFVSEELDFDPTMSIRVSNSSSLKVYLDKNNYDNYFVDVNEIKNNRI